METLPLMEIGVSQGNMRRICITGIVMKKWHNLNMIGYLFNLV